MKFVAYLLLYKRIEGSELLNQTISDMLTYSKEVETLYIFNYHRYPQTTLIDVLKMYKNIEYVDLPNKGQVANYSDALNHAVKVNADYATVIETGYFYEDNSYHEIKRMIIQNEFSDKTAVITPIPVLTCESKNDTKEAYRKVKGVHLTGAFINMNIYKQTEGFYLPYYQTTFDYDYCLQTRLLGYDVMLAQNLVLRKQNYKIITKKIGFISLSMHVSTLTSSSFSWLDQSFIISSTTANDSTVAPLALGCPPPPYLTAI